jgi:succinoglycan biosynthesis protein ExoO
VTVAIATYNAAAHVEAALSSIRRQTLDSLEILVVDDASSDTTPALVARIAQEDRRIRLTTLPVNGGPAAARNHALDQARGRWFAVVDSDDLIAPDRLKTMADMAEAQSADIIADDLVVFESDDPANARFFLPTSTGEGWIGATDYLARPGLFGKGVDYGYLKPMFRTGVLRAAGLRYDPALRIAEDDDLVLRCLLAGMRYWLMPVGLYAYRRHSASLSYRLKAIDAHAIVKASEQILKGQNRPVEAALLARRHTGLQRASSFARAMEAAKSGSWGRAIGSLLADPSAIALLRLPIESRMQRITGHPKPPESDPKALAALRSTICVDDSPC